VKERKENSLVSKMMVGQKISTSIGRTYSTSLARKKEASQIMKGIMDENYRNLPLF